MDKPRALSEQWDYKIEEGIRVFFLIISLIILAVATSFIWVPMLILALGCELSQRVKKRSSLVAS